MAIVGRELVLASDDGMTLPLERLIGKRLAGRYISTSSETRLRGSTLSCAPASPRAGATIRNACAGSSNDILAEIQPSPGEALRTLARITDLKLLISHNLRQSAGTRHRRRPAAASTTQRRHHRGSGRIIAPAADTH